MVEAGQDTRTIGTTCLVAIIRLGSEGEQHLACKQVLKQRHPAPSCKAAYASWQNPLYRSNGCG
jgi:hypothetical protein